MGNPDGFPFLQNFPSSFLWQRAFLVSLCFLWCFALTFLVNKSPIRSFLFFPLHFSCFSICLGRKIGKFRSMVDALESLVKFRRLYEIPNNVGVSYCLESKVGFRRGEGRVVIPLVAFARRVRIPMSDLLRNFLRRFKVCSDQCTSNMFRLISFIVELNRRLSLSLIEHDINFVYSFQDNRTSGFYLKTQHREVRLISCLPDSNKEMKGLPRYHGDLVSWWAPVFYIPR